MEKIIIAFRSRSDTLGFADFLRKNGAPVKIVNTPKAAGVGCGLSAETDARLLSAVRGAVRRFSAKSFAGIFAVVKERGVVRVVSV